ncbi:FHA domain-containing protein, partial [uncultured Tessaracoccus sp.]|uniref:FHA domain-containing protein n=1 Tax=uncultured Tessaracoccus sp. TaxID=905023 RepID=UPI00262C9D45
DEAEQVDEPEADEAEQLDELDPENIDEDASAEPEQLDEPKADEAEQVDEPEPEQPHVPWSPPPLPVSASSVPQSQVSPPGSRQAPVVVPGEFGEIDDETGTVFSTGLAATHKPPVTQAAPDPQVMAVPCRNGHANPRGASSCRLCDEPVDSSNPRLIRRPVLAAVISNQGDGTDLVSGVIVGRSPDSARGPQGSYLMRVSSSGNDISRNHILITPNEWNIVLTDLHSTNGTLVHPPGEPEFELRDGRSVTVEIGTELLLDDQVRLKIVPPRSS